MNWKILVDMDGVISDFTRGACKLWGKPYPYDDGKNAGEYNVPKLFGIDPVEFWTKYDDPKAWSSQMKMPESDRLIELAISCVGVENVCILSSPNLGTGSMVGKMNWILEHYPQLRRQYLFGPRKHFCAAKNHILIDDYDVNVDSFREAGGHAILLPRPWNRNHSLDVDPVDYVENSLRNLGVGVVPKVD